MKPSVSVIIPFYNRVDWLEEAVNSVLDQTYHIHELIIINDGSKEDISRFLEIYGTKIIYIIKENGGPATARNIGIELSSGDYIAFLDSDDIWLPQKLEKQISAMITTGAVWSHTSYETFSDKETNSVIKSIRIYDGEIYPDILSSCNIATPCVMIKGDVLRENSNFRFNKSMRYGQDSYLWLNLAVRFKIFAIDEVLTKVRLRGTNASLRARVQIEARSNIWRYIKQNRQIYFQKKISKVVVFAFCCTSLFTKVIIFIEKNIKNEMFVEYLSRIIYFIPWLLFKFKSRR